MTRKGSQVQVLYGSFWIPVNKAMFTGDDDYATTHDLFAMARSATRAFMDAHVGNAKDGRPKG